MGEDGLTGVESDTVAFHCHLQNTVQVFAETILQNTGNADMQWQF